ncbi:glycosyltransferase family A protein, partial [Okeania sp. SIO2G5]|uniref:glycosyltransferase family A protein n=1 Tax=Okeania sp. SIO2G5 TaxID=2607796 RepID=UPI0013C1E29C
IADPRFRIITSPLKGEVMQRLVGLLNVTSPYVMALDDDDYVHPDILRPVAQYFQTFPESWFLRLSKRILNFDQEDEIYSDWQAILDIDQMTPATTGRSTDKTILQEIPIAPLKNKFDARFLVSPYLGRKGMHGGHIENFNNKVWKTDLVQQALADMSGVMSLMNALTWIPKWSLDRLLGLFIQAKFFEDRKVVGHWMPHPEQIRYIQIPQTAKK